MSASDSTTPTLEGQLAELGPVDAVVGVATANNAATVVEILRVARQGAALNGGARGVVVFADGGSDDGTVERAQEALRSDEGAPHVVSRTDLERSPPGRPPGKAGAIRAIFDVARRVGARGCAVLDADRLGAGPTWVERLLAPVLDHDVDFVAPYYRRDRFDGAITSSIVYPTIRALYGKRLRFPLAADFACSPRLLDRYGAREALRETEVSRAGAELCLSTQALVGGFRVRQVVLGAKFPAAEAPVEDLPHLLSRVLGALFADVERNLTFWQKIRGSEPIETVGPPPLDEREATAIDPAPALDAFHLGHRNLREVWELVLPPLTLLELQKLARRPDAGMRFPEALWARIVYDFALAHRLRTIRREHLLAAFAPLYLGWFGCFVSELREADATAVEGCIEQLCLRYEAEKPYLISRWRWPDRFNP
jgi:hypothetical protein